MASELKATVTIDLKTQKYDRQLRLWQGHGQQALENASICVINASALGSELLKNLVLPGIGSFTLIDGKAVTTRDLGSNFFVTSDSIGQPRAKVVSEMLCELNEGVVSSHISQDPAELIQKNPDFFKKFTLVIATQLQETPLLSLAEICWNEGIPLVVAKIYGFFGYLRLVVPEHAVVETHPDQIVDLRLDDPFPELLNFAKGFDLPSLNSKQFVHVPYPVLLAQAFQEWKNAHNGAMPSTYKERNEFKQYLRTKQRKEMDDLENFDEAVAASFRKGTITNIPDTTKNILLFSSQVNIHSKTSNFWIIAKATFEFVQKEGKLPLAGSVPDMKADTESYVELQTIYKQKARNDAAVIAARVKEILTEVGKDADSITLEEINRFCKNVQYLEVLRFRNLKEEYNEGARSDIARILDQDLDGNIVYYLLLRAVEKFYNAYNTYPGAHIEDVEIDIGKLKKIVSGMLSRMDIPVSSISDDHIHEMVRAGASELHNLAAIMGGIGSQEVIKLITKQYVPLNNTFIFNGVKSSSSVFAFEDDYFEYAFEDNKVLERIWFKNLTTLEINVISHLVLLTIGRTLKDPNFREKLTKIKLERIHTEKNETSTKKFEVFSSGLTMVKNLQHFTFNFELPYSPLYFSCTKIVLEALYAFKDLKSLQVEPVDQSSVTLISDNFTQNQLRSLSLAIHENVTSKVPKKKMENAFDTLRSHQSLTRLSLNIPNCSNPIIACILEFLIRTKNQRFELDHFELSIQEYEYERISEIDKIIAEVNPGSFGFFNLQSNKPEIKLEDAIASDVFRELERCDRLKNLSQIKLSSNANLTIEKLGTFITPNNTVRSLKFTIESFEAEPIEKFV